MRLNREFIVTFQPKQPELFDGRRRFSVGAYSLHKYVGKSNAKTAIERALKSSLDKCSVKFRKHGRVDFYFK